MRRFATNGLVAAISIGIALVIAELLLRVAYPQQLGVWYSLRNGLVIHPPNTRVHLTKFKQDVRFNALGMRDVEHQIAKTPGVIRVLVLGDSFMEALQVRLEDSFPRLLEQRLRVMTGQPVEVINCAVSGWGTDQQLTYLTQSGLALKPDLVLIAMTLHNDISDNLGEQFHVLKSDQVIARPPYEMPGGEFWLLKVKDYLASHSHLTQLVRRYKYRGEVRVAARELDDRCLATPPEGGDRHGSKGLAADVGTIEMIDRESDEGGWPRAAVFLIPFSIQMYDDALRQWLVDSSTQEIGCRP